MSVDEFSYEVDVDNDQESDSDIGMYIKHE